MYLLITQKCKKYKGQRVINVATDYTNHTQGKHAIDQHWEKNWVKMAHLMILHSEKLLNFESRYYAPNSNSQNLVTCSIF